MKEILLINPRKRKKRASKGPKKSKRANPARKKARGTRKKAVKPALKTKGKAMAKRKKAKRKTKRRARRNPAPNPRRAYTRAKSAWSGLNFRSALKNVLPIQIGMFASKWAAKRFGEAATEIDPESWNYASYLKGALGALGGGIIMNMVRPGQGQKALEGGVNYLVFKLIENELIQKNDWARGQLGEDDGYYLGQDDGYYLGEGEIIIDEEGAPAMVGPMGEVLPLDESHRADPYALPEEVSGYYGDALEPVGPLGDAIVPISRLGDALEPVGPLGSIEDEYYKAYRA